MDRDKPMKNSVKTTTNIELLAYIQDSFLNPSAYMTNLKPVKEIDWQWDNGKTTTNITYVDDKLVRELIMILLQLKHVMILLTLLPH